MLSPEKLNLNQQSISSANNNSHFDAGNTIARSAEEVYKIFFDTFRGKEYTAEQAQYLNKRAELWKSLIENSFNDELHRRASYVPVNVCGPANYPSAKMYKTVDRLMQAARGWQQKRNDFIENTKKELKRLLPTVDTVELYRTGKCNDPISADDPAAVEKLKAKLEYLTAYQEHAKAVNAYYRKYKTMQGFPGMSADAADKIDRQMNNREIYLSDVPFASYRLTNNNATMKQVKDRIASIERTAKKIDESEMLNILRTEAAPEETEGFEIVHNTTENRLQLIFPGKPSEQIRSILKHNGYVWSPRFGAWQRQLTENAINDLNYRLLKELKEAI